MNLSASRPDLEECCREARELYRHYLAGWASDLLAIRRERLEMPSWRPLDVDEQHVLRRAA